MSYGKSPMRYVLWGPVYKILFGGLRTAFAESPRVMLDAVDERSRVVMDFASSPIVEGEWQRAVITFSRVIDFHFYDFEIGLPFPDEDQFEFALIECLNSQLVSGFASSGALGMTAQPIISVEKLRHFRIGFDDHGVYDIVCLDVSLQIVETHA